MSILSDRLVSKIFLSICLLIWAHFCAFPNVFAARSLSIEANSPSLFGDEGLILTASASGFTQGEMIYIKGAFYKEGSTNYFAYTKKDEAWVRNSSSTQEQRQVKIGEWDQKLVVKGDFTDSGYLGEDDYFLKVGFYYTTSTGGFSSVNWSSNILVINLNEPNPTPSPTLVVTSSPTVVYPVSQKISTPVPKITPSSTKSASFDRIAGDLRISSQYASLKTKLARVKKAGKNSEVRVLGAKDYNFSFATITTGFLLIWLGIGTFFFKYLRTKQIL